MKVGDEVEIVCDIYEGPDDCSPGGYFAKKGETLIVRDVRPESPFFQIYVSHAHITDNSFGVRANEIAAKSAPATTEEEGS